MRRAKLEEHDVKIAHQVQIRLGLTGFAINRNVYCAANTDFRYVALNGANVPVFKDLNGWHVTWPHAQALPQKKGNATYRIAGPRMWWEERHTWRPH